jgi:hypothetical protein
MITVDAKVPILLCLEEGRVIRVEGLSESRCTETATPSLVATNVR